VRRATQFPVFHAARIQDVATARHAIASGKLDMVGMTRAHIAEPHIGRLLTAGRESEIRPCVGATYCLDRIYEGNDAVCVHNPATGREAAMPHVVTRGDGPRRKVVVVGAGPGGLEAARVSAARGHDVVLFEAAERPGGQVLLASRTSRRRELVGIIDWRMQRLAADGVVPRFSTYAHVSDVLAEMPDIVFLATGGVPNVDVLESGSDLCVSTWDILSGAAQPAQRVLIYDDNGAHPAMQAAELLAEAGSSVEIVTPERYFAPEIGGLNHAAYAEIFHRHGVRITINARVTSVWRDGNALRAGIGSDHGPERFEREVDQVVVEHGTLPDTDLYDSLRPLSLNLGEVDYTALIAGRPQTVVRNPAGAFRLFRIGDAVASRNIHAAIYDALRLAKDL
jgi:NADPH-dependent 2,4-dienoyl-CoA reductase/sulfur reductase-like enzyme